MNDTTLFTRKLPCRKRRRRLGAALGLGLLLVASARRCWRTANSHA